MKMVAKAKAEAMERNWRNWNDRRKRSYYEKLAYELSWAILLNGILEIITVIFLRDSNVDILVSKELQDQWQIICVKEKLREVLEFEDI